MSSIVKQFDPSTSTSTSFTAPNSAANGSLVFWNESNVSVDLTFADGTNMYLPAWYHRKKCGATGSVNVTWAVNTTLNTSQPPMSQIIVEAYTSGETSPSDGPLVRQTNGTVQTVGGTASLLVNDTSNSGAQIIETRVPNDLGSGFAVMNNGHVLIGFGSAQGNLDLGYPTMITFEAGPGQQSGGNPSLSLDASGILHINTNGGLHQVQIDGNTTINFDGANGAINMATNSTVLNGGTSGTATLYQDLTGNIKRVIIYLSSFRPGVSAQNIAIPTPFTTSVSVRTAQTGASSSTSGISLLKSGVAQNVSAVTTLSLTAAAFTTGTVFNQGIIGYCESGVDTVQFQGGTTASHTGMIILEGI